MNEKAVIAMFTLILATFYFILDIDSGEKCVKSPVRPHVFLYIIAVSLII